MPAWFNDLLVGTGNFMPHGACYLWLPSILWLHIISDSIIALAYFSIPFALWYFVKKRSDLVYRWVFVLFGVFICLCGTTHLISIWTIWHPDYWLDGLIKAATALVSIVTALLIWPLIPKLLQLPSPQALQTTETYLEQIKQLAFFDPLTQLPNRRLLQERLKHGIDVERRDGKQLALLMLDLDRFKAVNDSLGHLAGDELLQQVAARITARLREVDMVARLGGDEFIVLLQDIAHPEDAARVAEDIIADLSELFCVAQGEEVRIGASIGISLYPQHGDSPEILMDHADAALYQAKDAGRGCFAYFSEDLTLAARERIALESRLRRAIEQGELRVFYQPQVDIAGGRIVGAEALVRWLDPLEGLIPPIRFIPIAEDTGLIVAIGEWVLRETCRQGREWLDAGLPPLTLAVNVSSHQFRRSDICNLVATVLNETRFPAKQLELEITESGLMENQDKAPDILNCLRNQGIRLAIDDFGTGYSSLAYLKHFPLDLLKIDKSFIDDIPHMQDDMEIAATIIAMGHILGFKVLAEGVETAEQLAFLQEKGCDMYQGYINSKPVPGEVFAELLRDQHRR